MRQLFTSITYLIFGISLLSVISCNNLTAPVDSKTIASDRKHDHIEVNKIETSRDVKSKKSNCVNVNIIDQFGIKKISVGASISPKHQPKKITLSDDLCVGVENEIMVVNLIIYVFKQSGSKYRGPADTLEVAYEYPYTADNLDLSRGQKPEALISRYLSSKCSDEVECLEVEQSLRNNEGLTVHSIVRKSSNFTENSFCFVWKTKLAFELINVLNANGIGSGGIINDFVESCVDALIDVQEN